MRILITKDFGFAGTYSEEEIEVSDDEWSE